MSAAFFCFFEPLPEAALAPLLLEVLPAKKFLILEDDLLAPLFCASSSGLPW
jgi:hypothetical protein